MHFRFALTSSYWNSWFERQTANHIDALSLISKNSNMIKRILVALILCVVTIGQVNAQKSKWKKFETKKYSVKYPSDWDFKSGSGDGFMVFSPLENKNDGFKENVNFLIQDLSAYDIDMNQYIQITLDEVKTMLKKSELIENKRIKKGKNEYHKLIYSGQMDSFHFTFEQYIWIKSKTAYVLTFASERDKFNKFKTTGEKIMNSFVIK